MNLVDNVQSGLSTLQAIPVLGPTIFSPVKAMVSQAQIVTGFVLGIFSGMGATSMALAEDGRLAGRFTKVSLAGFSAALQGFASLFYACANMATLGLLGLCVELRKRDAIVINISFSNPFQNRRFCW